MMTKTSEVQIFTFTGRPERLCKAITNMLEATGNRVIDVISVTESMTTVQGTGPRGFSVGFPKAVLHHTMLYRLT